ncbi:MAG: DUF1707 domain-containing protein [Actinomycetota bacterium]|nr:DUF1707 domain-containing protein [Actinomycetota bacterium]
MAPDKSLVWTKFSSDPRDPVSAGLRATDTDRHVVTSALADAYADGRLDRGEYDERSDLAVTAKLLGDFVPLLKDLAPETTAALVKRTQSQDLHVLAERKYARDLRDARNGFLGTSAICCAIWAVTSVASGGAYFFWPIFPMLGVGIGYFSMRLNKESQTEAIWDKLAAKRRIERGIDDA